MEKQVGPVKISDGPKVSFGSGARVSFSKGSQMAIGVNTVKIVGVTITAAAVWAAEKLKGKIGV